MVMLAKVCSQNRFQRVCPFGDHDLSYHHTCISKSEMLERQQSNQRLHILSPYLLSIHTILEMSYYDALAATRLAPILSNTIAGCTQALVKFLEFDMARWLLDTKSAARSAMQAMISTVLAHHQLNSGNHGNFGKHHVRILLPAPSTKELNC